MNASYTLRKCLPEAFGINPDGQTTVVERKRIISGRR